MNPPRFFGPVFNIIKNVLPNGLDKASFGWGCLLWWGNVWLIDVFLDSILVDWIRHRWSPLPVLSTDLTKPNHQPANPLTQPKSKSRTPTAMQQQVVECVSLQELHKYVDPATLPAHLGGTSTVPVGESGARFCMCTGGVGVCRSVPPHTQACI